MTALSGIEQSRDQVIVHVVDMPKPEGDNHLGWRSLTLEQHKAEDG